jgi:hypothetical protein
MVTTLEAGTADVDGAAVDAVATVVVVVSATSARWFSASCST